MAATLTNWAGNVEFTTRTLHRPASPGRLRDLVADAAAAGGRLKVLGSGHSFNRIADTTGALLALDALPGARTAEVDTASRTVRVGGATRFGELCPVLRRHGLALPNLPSTPHFTLAGAYATGTHGSGHTGGTLAAAVRSVELLTADGETVTVTRGTGGPGGAAPEPSDEFFGSVVSLGALGVVTALTVEAVEAYEIEQYVYEGLPWPVLTEHAGRILGAAYSVSVFTDWSGPPRVWVKHRAGDPRPDLAWTGARPADGPRHPIEGMPVENATEQGGVPGPWDERLPHFRAGFVPSVGDELQSEYFVPAARAAESVAALRELGDLLAPVLQVSEIRTVAADPHWLSPAHGRDSVAFHFTWIPDTTAVGPVLLRIEEALAPFGVRPHWGKLSGTAPQALAAAYEHWTDFRTLLGRRDPAGVFRNALLDRWFPPEPDGTGRGGAERAGNP
ncbi:FAD-binding protein [Streptomyces sp. TRM 70361]|uniref:FAD-binding protein n=1 Tax=Streptomyces sp. TRM 70361 TaxID=3116553 RepID=UPI002E7C1A32|nr:FAD-binding protein [Streptomyces sp. TRM 70361]MEE1939684.1 FAD-binding protein [Streptomyces sp. TRM 70361]